MKPPLIVLMAAGQSRRFNGVKLAQVIDDLGTPLLLDSYRKLKGFSDELGAELVVILGAHADLLSSILPDDAKLVYNSQWQQGMSTSVKAAVGYAQAQGAESLMISLADQVALQPEHFHSLIKARSQLDPRVWGFNLGSLSVPAIFHRDDYPKLRELSGDSGAKLVLNDLYKSGKMLAIEMESASFDIDTRDDLKNWLAACSSRIALTTQNSK
ncbi:nucleotidyltransferase family protein [Shewanella sp.]|uniref:nucleotidyltransferase family protein n=1 Tax=Shewanella sp. TaxID=50422 RepID=UPI00258BA881|nr:nucleotidyltransferase family protein [Shewanella sp.]MCJ8304903.1 nucleotidyltransferase family protein [Shewanella sp.]